MEMNDRCKLKKLFKDRDLFFKEYLTEDYSVLKMDNGDTFIDFLFSKAKGNLINIRPNKVF